MAGHVHLNLHGELKDWEEGSPRWLRPITAAGRATGPARVLPQRFHAGGLGLRTSCLVWRATAHALGMLRGVSVWQGCRGWGKAQTDGRMGHFCPWVTSGSVLKILTPLGFCCAVNYVTECLQLRTGSCWIIWIMVSKTNLAERREGLGTVPQSLLSGSVCLIPIKY